MPDRLTKIEELEDRVKALEVALEAALQELRFMQKQEFLNHGKDK